MMDEYLNKGIKEIITQFPKVGDILDEFNIGCGPCSVGTCLLKDIVEVHHLIPIEEQQLMARISSVIYPDKETETQVLDGPIQTTPKEITYSTAMRKLVDEHKLILRWVALIPKVIESLEEEIDRELILQGTDFMQFYADKFHHAKEEDVLFKYFDEGIEIIKVMHEDHTIVRALRKAIRDAVETKDKVAIARDLDSYRELLIEHIRKEDEILFPWLDGQMSNDQTNEMYSKFIEIDEESKDTSVKYEQFISKTEERFNLT